jgi:hypothetical protein
MGPSTTISKENATRQSLLFLAKLEQEGIMSHQLEIPDELYAALQAAADANGTTPLGWIAAQLPQPGEIVSETEAPDGGPKTLADLFAGRVGRIQSGGRERLSEACGEQFTDYVEAKRKAGRV